MRYAVVSYDVDDEPQRKKAKLRGGLDEVIAQLVIDHDCAASDVLAWCELAVDEAFEEKTRV